MKSRLCALVVLLCLFAPLSTLHAQGDTIVSIAYGQAVEGEIENAKNVAVFRFVGQKGDRVTIKVKSLSSGFQPGVILTNKDIKTIANGIVTPITGFKLPATAPYMIVVGSARGTGKFSLSLVSDKVSVKNTPEPVNPATGTPEPGPSVQFGPGEESPASLIVFSSDSEGNADIYSVNPDGSNLKRLTSGKGVKYSPAWSPDGTQIAYRLENNNQAHIYVMDADGSNAHQVTKGNYKDYQVAWSPDGQRFAVTSGTAWNAADVYVINIDGSNRKIVAKTNNTASQPSWSPDGKQIVFNKNDGNVYTVSASGGTAKILVKNGSDARWSPDGKTLVFANGDINLLKNGKTIRLTDTPEKEYHPVWSPDGQQIAFMRSSDDGSTWRIYVMSVDGSGEVAVSPEAGNSSDEWWSPK
jgi:Tol biopolymer transport system component